VRVRVPRQAEFDKLTRVVQLWGEKDVFPAKEMDALRAVLSGSVDMVPPRPLSPPLIPPGAPLPPLSSFSQPPAAHPVMPGMPHGGHMPGQFMPPMPPQGHPMGYPMAPQPMMPPQGYPGGWGPAPVPPPGGFMPDPNVHPLLAAQQANQALQAQLNAQVS
jgi:hypothetical protein